MILSIARKLLVVTVSLLAACGGGGGGSSSSTPPGSVLSLSPLAVAVSATTTGTTPSATIQATASNVPAAGLYAGVSYTTNGVSSVNLTSAGASEDVNISFKSPATLAVGVYTDTVSFEACYDQACTKQISGSPQQVAVTYTVTAGNPGTATPTISLLSPASATAGSGAFTLAITGGNFASGSVVLWNGLPRATTYVSPTALTAQITALDIASAGTASVTVSNAATGGGVSAASPFTINATAPMLSALSPAAVYVGGAAFTLTVSGSGFDTLAQVSWNGSVRATTFVSPNQVTAQINATDIAIGGSYAVTVTNQDLPSQPSNALTVVVSNAPLALASVSPTAVTAGGQAYVQTVLGSGFTSGSTVQWNGSARSTTFVSTTELLAQVSASDIAAQGSASVTVLDPSANPNLTSAATVTIAKASVDAVAFQINPQHNGAVNFANIVAPTAFPLTATWSATLDGPPSYALVAGGMVFVTVALSGASTSELVALDAANGGRVWGPIALAGQAAAAYDNGKVFVLTATSGASPGIVYAYDAATGNPLWSSALTSQYLFTGPPTAANGHVYAGGAGVGGTLYAVNETNGALDWSSMVMNGDNSSPAVTADGVYVTYPCQTYDFRPLTGEQIWNNSTGCEGGGGATGAWANGAYYSPNGTSGFNGMVFNGESGALLASYSASAPPAIGASMGYYLQSGTLRGITLSNNTIQWSFAGDGTLTSPPVLVNNYVFILGSSGNLYGLDAASGAQLWQSNLGGSATFNYWFSLAQAGLAAGDGLLVVPAGNTLTAFTLSTNP